MAPEHEIETRVIRIHVAQRRGGDLLVAYSDDLKGLMVPGRSDEELEKKLPAAVREILEAQGHKVLSVTADADHLPDAFMAHEFIANAEIETVH